ncbi:hypothetical protein KC221_23135, partial [Mycobacterium tuberculosis]|nr:hypothetical protein [Mycobacterium tuberculosis]
SDDITRERLRTIVQDGDASAMPEVLAAIRATGGLEYSRARAEEYAEAAERALDGLGDNDAVAALRGPPQPAPGDNAPHAPLRPRRHRAPHTPRHR